MEFHLNVIKRILKFLHGTINLGLWYSKGTHFNITSYSDIEILPVAKPTTRALVALVIFLNMLVSWFSKK